MTYDLLVSFPKTKSLDEVASLIFALVQADNVRERESEHYVGGQYFLAESETASFKLWAHDDPDHSDLPFNLAIAPTDGSEGFDIEAFSRRVFGCEGIKTAWLRNPGLASEIRVNY